MLIRWTEPAARDLTNICDYTEEHDGPEAARRAALRIYEGVGTLARFPRRGRPGRKPGTRELVFPGLPFLAIYRVGEEVVEIDRVLHGAQKWPRNLNHPSLHAKKFDEAKGRWQARVNHDWRFYFTIDRDTYRISEVIPHPK